MCSKRFKSSSPAGYSAALTAIVSVPMHTVWTELHSIALIVYKCRKRKTRYRTLHRVLLGAYQMCSRAFIVQLVHEILRRITPSQQLKKKCQLSQCLRSKISLASPTISFASPNQKPGSPQARFKDYNASGSHRSG